LLFFVDNAQWLDRASSQALGFVARRLLEESIVMLVATRERSDDFNGLRELAVRGLRDADARALLRSVVPGRLDELVCERIVAETRGNPLALLELPKGLSASQLAGGFGLPDALPLSAPIRERFMRQIEEMPEATRLLLLIAAEEPVGDPSLVWHAAERLGIPSEAVAPAERAGLLEIGSWVSFRHPLVRSAVCQGACPAERRRAHWALADATDPQVDPDRRAWHLAQATVNPDERVAVELERCADRAQARGGLAAAAAFLERAVGMTVDPSRRACRALAAADATYVAGGPEAAMRLLGIAQAGALDELGRARVDLLRAQIAFATTRGPEARRLLLRAARRLEPLDVALARETYLEALTAAYFTAGVTPGTAVEEVAEAVLAAPPAPSPPRASDLLLDGLAARCTAGYGEALPMLRRATHAFTAADLPDEEVLRWMWIAGYVAVDVWDDKTLVLLASRCLHHAWESGALTVLPLVLGLRILVHALAGELAAAAELVQEQRQADEVTGRCHPPRYAAPVVAAWRGREAEVSELAETLTRDTTARDERVGHTVIQWARAVLYNGLGGYREALRAAERACAYETVGLGNLALAELVLAAVRSGDVERAVDALGRLSVKTQASGTEWALGVEAGARALLSEGESAERLHLEAIERLGHTHIRVALARAHLSYGEWLRRERRREDARGHLRTAFEMLTAMGARAFAQRAQRELLAAGEHAPRHHAETRERLTAQEAQVARLARDGLSNPEIGARLFISRRTAEYHLRKVFAKLQITSRSELSLALPAEPSAALAY
jgi:DNA-binding CsgD family transcriptional regulator